MKNLRFNHTLLKTCYYFNVVVTSVVWTSPVRIEVQAGSFSRFNTPVSLDLTGLLTTPDSCGFALTEIRQNVKTPVSCQIEPGRSPRLWWILSGPTDSGSVRVFELAPGHSLPEKGDSVFTVLDDRALTLVTAGRKILRYNHAVMDAPRGADPRFRRSGFIHPLWSPSGFALTCIQPPDHVHHYGIWNPWTKTRFVGREVDFWNLGDGEGTVRFAGFLSRTHGPVYGGFKSRHEHVDLTAAEREKTALDEVWEVRVWNASGTRDGAWLCDFSFTFSCASDSPLELEAYRYGGGIGFRAAAEWTAENAAVLTSGGLTRKDADGTRARWVDVSGATDMPGRAGVVFLSHPWNREHPEPMRVWPVDANNGRGDLFFEFCPIRLKAWTLVPGSEYVLNYRLLVYDGKVGPEDCERAWNDFAAPPEVRIR